MSDTTELGPREDGNEFHSRKVYCIVLAMGAISISCVSGGVLQHCFNKIVSIQRIIRWFEDPIRTEFHLDIYSKLKHDSLRTPR